MPDNDSPPATETALDRLRRLAAEAQAARSEAAASTAMPAAGPEAAPAAAPAAVHAAASDDDPAVEPAAPVRQPPPGLARPIEPSPPVAPVPVDELLEATPVETVAETPAPVETPAGAESTLAGAVTPSEPDIVDVPMQSERGEARRTPRGLVLLTGVLTLLVLLAAIGLLLARHRQTDHESAAKNTAAAKAAAAQMMVDIETVDYTKIQEWLPRVQRDSTGAQLASFNNDSDLFSQATKTNKLVSQGHVVTSAFCGGPCASAQVTGNTATALVFTNAKVITSVTSPAGGVSLDRWSLKLTKVKGQWLTVEVDQVPVSPAS